MSNTLDIPAALSAYRPPLCDFLFDLVVDPDCDDPLYGGCPWFRGDGFRFNRASLDAHAHQWAADENLPWSDRAGLLIQLNNLPWRNDEIVFYWGDDP